MHMLISHWQTNLQTSISSTYFSKEAKEKHLILRLSLQIPAAKSKPGMQDMSNMTMRFKESGNDKPSNIIASEAGVGSLSLPPSACEIISRRVALSSGMGEWVPTILGRSCHVRFYRISITFSTR